MSDDVQRKAMALRIREARVAAGLSQTQVARLMGLHRPAVSEIEAGNRNVKADELEKFAGLFDVSMSFLTGSDPESSSLDDVRVQLAARELRKLDPEALERVLKVIATIRGASSKPPGDE